MSVSIGFVEVVFRSQCSKGEVIVRLTWRKRIRQRVQEGSRMRIGASRAKDDSPDNEDEDARR